MHSRRCGDVLACPYVHPAKLYRDCVPDNVLHRGRSCSSVDEDRLDAASGVDGRKDTLMAGLHDCSRSSSMAG